MRLGNREERVSSNVSGGSRPIDVSLPAMYGVYEVQGTYKKTLGAMLSRASILSIAST